GTRAVIMDFGLAKPAPSEDGQQKITDTGVILGTPEFMSPEQIRGLPLDPRSDQYALGVLAFELLTGELPFPGGTSQETMRHRRTEPPAARRSRRPEATAALEATLPRALARDREDRFPDL
ncbi:MAG: protein kinase, partial [Gemmatimonadales bacterium]|nr:protein kinase [Gemmatimonadales bacterium]